MMKMMLMMTVILYLKMTWHLTPVVSTSQVFNDVEVDLQYFGKSVSGEILVHHNNVCCNEPVLEQYDAWGKRVDNIIMHPSWKSLHDIAAKEKLISIPYENKYEEWRYVLLHKFQASCTSSRLACIWHFVNVIIFNKNQLKGSKRIIILNFVWI